MNKTIYHPIHITNIREIISNKNWFLYQNYLKNLHFKTIQDLYRNLRKYHNNRPNDLIDLNNFFINEMNSGMYDDRGSLYVKDMINLRTFN